MNPLVTEARALCRDATTGPWNDFEGSIGDGYYPVAQCTEGHPDEDANGRFIARSRTLLPEMAAEIERLEADISELKHLEQLNANLHRKLHDRTILLKTELDALKADIEAGRLVRLPFKPGDVLYAIIPKSYEGDCDTHVSPWKSIAAVIYEDGSIAAMDCDENFDKIGTSYAYLTEAEALAAMKEDAHG